MAEPIEYGPPWCACAGSTPAVSADGFCWGCERWIKRTPGQRCEAACAGARCTLEAGHTDPKFGVLHDAGWSFRDGETSLVASDPHSSL